MGRPTVDHRGVASLTASGSILQSHLVCSLLLDTVSCCETGCWAWSASCCTTLMHCGREQDQPEGASPLGQVLGQVHEGQPEQQKPCPWLLEADWLCAADPGSAGGSVGTDLRTHAHLQRHLQAETKVLKEQPWSPQAEKTPSAVLEKVPHGS